VHGEGEDRRVALEERGGAVAVVRVQSTIAARAMRPSRCGTRTATATSLNRQKPSP
jgi:hypothetical protein